MKNLFLGLLILLPTITSSAQNLSELESLTQSAVGQGIEKEWLPGLVVSIIQGDQRYKGGFGYAQLGDKVAVDTSTTLFQLGSVGKAFTAIAVMQQVEKGNLDLNKDVNSYLSEFQIENPYDTPITLFHLLTHTAGFNDHVIGYAARNLSELEDLGDHLANNMPSLFQEAGKEINYSNYSYALAGHLVELASGMSFQDYVDNNIFKPLGMDHTSFLLPDDYSSRSEYAFGYRSGNEDFEIVPSFPRHPFPAGSIISTADDMTLFIAELLHPSNKILSQESLDRLFTRQYSQESHLMGYSLGLEEQSVNGSTGFGKGGNIPGFLSWFAIYPDQDLAIFVATNTQTDNFLDMYSTKLREHFFLKEDGIDEATGPTLDLSDYTGTFTGHRTNKSTIEELAFLFQSNFAIGTDGDYLSYYHDGAWQKYRAVDTLVFQNTEISDVYLVFAKSDKGTIDHVYRNVDIGGNYVPESLERVAWYDDPYFINEYYFLNLVFIAAVLLVLPFRLFVWFMRRKKPAFLMNKLLPSRHFWLAILIAILYLIQFVYGFMNLFRNTQEFFFGVPDSFLYAQALTTLIPFVVLALLILTWTLWKKRMSVLFTRIVYSLFTISAVIHLLFLWRWHFIGMNW